MSTDIEEMLSKPPIDCPYCGKVHLQYACNAELQYVKELIEREDMMGLAAYGAGIRLEANKETK